MRISTHKITLCFILLLAVLLPACSRGVKPAESPEEVVRKFYAYVKEGGTTTLGEAYRLIDAKGGRVDEDSFKKTVSSYPKDMDVKVVGSAIDGKSDRAVVTIEYRTESAFGGYMVSKTDVNLKLDREAKAWRIDYAGETYDESPASYSVVK